MATIRVTHSIGDLTADLRAAPVKLRRLGKIAVKTSIEEGAEDTKRIADAAAGPHGSNYSNRISAEMTGALEGEYGPSAVVGSRYTGVGGSAGAMRDLTKSALRQGPRFQKRVGLVADRLLPW